MYLLPVVPTSRLARASDAANVNLAGVPGGANVGLDGLNAPGAVNEGRHPIRANVRPPLEVASDAGVIELRNDSVPVTAPAADAMASVRQTAIATATRHTTTLGSLSIG